MSKEEMEMWAAQKKRCCELEIGLKRCPFCGAFGRVQFDELHGKFYYSVGCSDMKCFGTLHTQLGYSEEQLEARISAWNQRTKSR